MIVAGKEVTVIDTVTLDGLEKGTKYQLKGWEMVKSENAELLVGGERVENDLAFTATDTKMEVQITFTFNASELAGKELVTFEELYDLSNPDEPTKVAEHKDIEDDGQTVTITERIITMHTTATDKATGKKTIEAGKDVTIVDTVTLDGLEKGVKYQLKGWEMVKSENAELIINGKRVENDLTFTATDTKMEVQIAFTFNASELAGKDLVTFDTSSQMTDGAGFVVLMSEEKAAELGVKPLARFVSFATGGVPAEVMGVGPIEAVPKALRKAGLTLEQMDTIELNEAFASQALAVIRTLGMDPARVNPWGGAMALGHPLGATGAMLTCKALSYLERTGGRYGMVTMCIGGGMGAAGIFECL